MPEADLEDSGSGLAPASEGWFVVNVRDAQWLTSEKGDKRPSGSECSFESGKFPFRELGVRLHVLEPGEDEERTLRPWDFFHCPAGTEHIFVGAGSGPCVIFMAGARSEDDWNVRYPVSELAARYGASAEVETTEPEEAYVDFEPSRRARPSYWNRLPWAGSGAS